METVLLTLRWAVALFLFLMAVLFPLEFWKRRERGGQGIAAFALGLALAGIASTLGYGMVMYNWSPLWLAFRGACALVLLAIAAGLMMTGSKDPESSVLRRTLFLCLGGVFVPPAVSIVLLDWRWLLLTPVLALLCGVIMIAGRVLNRKRLIEAVRELGVKTRGEKLTREEAAHRLSQGETVALGAAFEELRRGKAMTPQEVESFAIEQKEAFARLDEQQHEREEQCARAQAAEEAAAEALRQKMQTGAAYARFVIISLESETTLKGADGAQLVLPVGPGKLWLKMVLPLPEEDCDGYPAVQTDLWIEGGPRVRISHRSFDLVDLREVPQASWWRAKDEAWRRSFCESVLLEPTECAEDEKAWIEFPVDEETLSFYSRSGEKTITFACPAPGDAIWCRVHGLTYLEQEEDGDWVKVEPFCFPIPIERFLGPQEE